MSNTIEKFISLIVLNCFLILVISDENSQKSQQIKNDKGEIVYPDNLMIHHHGFHNFHHHHHYHNHDFPNHPLDGEHPDDDEQEEDETQFQNSSATQIPLNYIQNLNKYNLSDLLLNFVDGHDDDAIVIQDRFGDNEGQERSAATMAKGAECMPELKTVKIATSEDPSILYIPQCTRIERCGGCCKHELLSCQPSKVENIPFKVYKTQYTGEKKLKFLGTELVTVEKHSKCKCLCRVKAEDCTKFQEYKESECRCACMNHDEKKKCLKYNETKLWNPDLCACQCRETMICSTGSYFDQNECKCVALNIKRRFANYQRRSFKSEPLPVVPLNEDD